MTLNSKVRQESNALDLCFGVEMLIAFCRLNTAKGVNHNVVPLAE